MAKIRRVEIANFRGIHQLVWDPSPGINCLIGPGDSGKSSILDAIDLCLGARRNLQVDDSDFHRLDTSQPICIEVTLGELEDSLRNLDSYGLYLRGLDPGTLAIEDEPGSGLETVLTLRLTIADDLEPQWQLVSDRAAEQDLSRGLAWADRVRLSPARIGVGADYHFRWSRGSVLNRISTEKPEVRAALAAAGRTARDAFGESADAQLGETLEIVAEVATELGVPVGDAVKALLDLHAITMGAGVVSLHDEAGVPLRRLGVGSTRLLVAGLQRRAAEAATVLVDEVEHGLEPHRIVRLLHSLGSKEAPAPLQVFMNTHSPTVLEELSGDQLFVVRNQGDHHTVFLAGSSEEVQGALRKSPSVFLAASIVACEGPSEVGLLRGIDLHRAASGLEPIAAQGVALANLGGGDPNRMLRSVKAFQSLGYRTAFVRDADKVPNAADEAQFVADGGHLMCCESGRAIEEEIFLSVSPGAVGALVELATQIWTEPVIDQQLRSGSNGQVGLEGVRRMCADGSLDLPTRQLLGSIAKGTAAWFKTVGRMEAVGRNIVGPGLDDAADEFRAKIEELLSWASRPDDD